MTGTAGEVTIDFNDGLSYERFMGRWSRAAGASFLDWVAPPQHARWLEIGCGTGAFTELVLGTCSPALLVAVDPAAGQIETAKRQLGAKNVEFQIADAHRLPFRDSSFDIIAGALVLNFIADRQRALDDIMRVGRTGATVAAYVWDFASDRAPNSCLALGLRRMGIDAPAVPGTEGSTLRSLTSSFEMAGFHEVAATSFDVPIDFADFGEFWEAQTPGFSPLTKIIVALPQAECSRLKAFVRSQVLSPTGAVCYLARANMIKARIA